MKILVTNDDGIEAPGLWALAGELQKVGQVKIVAPQWEQSGVASSVSLRQAIKVDKIESQVEGVEAFSVEGTPADCVIIALRSLFPDEIDLLVSGINRGPNIGHDVFVSGTVGAALQGYLRGLPSLAISLNGYEGLNFEVAAKLAALLAAKINQGVLPKGILLNVNLPNLPLEKTMGMEVTKLSKQSYCDAVERDRDSQGGCYRIMRGREAYYGAPGSDIGCLQLNKISVTPLLDSSVVNPLHHLLQSLIPVIYEELHSY